MCGFVGAFSSEKLSLHCKRKMKVMINQIKHRGPDEFGSYEEDKFFVQFARLSIIDLKKRSNQPFLDTSKRYVIVYNGEIYNFLDIKKNLQKQNVKFRTTSDTEVVVESFKKWGVNSFNKFQGMFSIVIYDRKKKKIILSRDHFGIKPIYYLKLNNTIYFSSEIKPLKNIFEFNLNEEKIIEFCVFGNLAGEDTLIKNVKQINSGEFIEVDHNINLKKNLYFDVRETFYNSKKKNFIPDIHKSLIDSVKMHTISDVGYATQLSGGLDSSLITAMTSKINSKKNKIHTYSVTLKNKNMNEKKYQDIVSKKYKTVHHGLECKPKMISKNLKKCIWMYDYPLHHPNIIPSFLMNKLASKNKVKVILSGDGADEIFEGYKWSLDLNRNKNYDPIFFGSYLSYEIVKKIFSKIKHSFENRRKFIHKIDDKKIALSILNQKYYLDKWLHRQDRAGMYASVEIRVPFCNLNLVKKVNSISYEDKTNFGKDGKFILKEISKNYLNERIYRRKKIGFPLPLDDWFRKDFDIMNLLKYIQDEKFYSRNIYNHKFVEKLIENHLNKKQNFGRELWVLLNVELWHRVFID